MEENTWGKTKSSQCLASLSWLGVCRKQSLKVLQVMEGRLSQTS